MEQSHRTASGSELHYTTQVRTHTFIFYIKNLILYKVSGQPSIRAFQFYF